MQVINHDTQTGTAAATANLSSVDVNQANGYSVVIQATVATAAAKTFVAADVAASTDRITIASHGYYTGLKMAASTDGVLPAGLAATDYYAIRVDANTIKLASSQANALAGTAVDITDAGTGNQTLTPAALAGGSYKLQGSLDDVVFVDLGVTANITATANFIHEKVDPMFKHVRVVFAATAGQIAYDVQTLVKG